MPVTVCDLLGGMLATQNSTGYSHVRWMRRAKRRERTSIMNISRRRLSLYIQLIPTHRTRVFFFPEEYSRVGETNNFPASTASMAEKRSLFNLDFTT